MGEAIDGGTVTDWTELLADKLNFIIAILAKVVAEFVAVHAEFGKDEI